MFYEWGCDFQQVGGLIRGLGLGLAGGLLAVVVRLGAGTMVAIL